MKLINIGVIGCAEIASRYVIPSILSLPNNFNLVGVASRTKEKASEFASKFDTVAFVDYNSLLDDNTIDAVYIPLPNALHADWIEKALKKNIHVLVEKSLACTYDDVIRLNDLAAKRKLALVENFQFRFHPQLKLIKSIVDNGDIGELRCFRSSFGFPPFKDEKNIRYQKDLGGGSLLDAGAYPLKLVQLFLGDSLQVTSSKLIYDEVKKVDIWGGASLKQTHGDLFGQVAFGFDNYYQCNLELWGSKGKVFTNRIFTAPPNYSTEIIKEVDNKAEKITVDPFNHFEGMLKHFSNLITTGKDLSTEFNQNVNQSRLIHQVKEMAN